MGVATCKQSNSTAFHLSFAGRLTSPVRNRRVCQAKTNLQTRRNVLVMYDTVQRTQGSVLLCYKGKKFQDELQGDDHRQ